MQHEHYFLKASENLGNCWISFLVQPGWSPGVTVCLSASGICNMNIIFWRHLKIKAIVEYPFWFSRVEVLASLYAWALLGYSTWTLFYGRIWKSRQLLNILSGSAGWSPGVTVCLSASGICNMNIIFWRHLKIKAIVEYPFWFSLVEVLASLYAWALLGYSTWVWFLGFWDMEHAQNCLWRCLHWAIR